MAPGVSAGAPLPEGMPLAATEGPGSVGVGDSVGMLEGPGDALCAGLGVAPPATTPPGSALLDNRATRIAAKATVSRINKAA